jgi:hypothetical protein
MHAERGLVEEQRPVKNSILWDMTPYSPVEVHQHTRLTSHRRDNLKSNKAQ